MTATMPATVAADEFCTDCGYEPELKRTLNSFQMFASDVRDFVRVGLSGGRRSLSYQEG